MRLLRFAITVPLVLLLIAGCSAQSSNSTATPAANPTFNLKEIVKATMDALTAQATPLPSAAPVTPSATVLSTPGSIAGNLTYPADTMPALYVAALQVGTQAYQYVITQPGQTTYEIKDLPAGTWNIVAYTVGGGGFPAGLAGGYTKAVPCGLATECADHALIDVTVQPGQHVSGITPSDWYAPPGSFPPFPGAPALTAAAATTSSTPLPTLPVSNMTGTP